MIKSLCPFPFPVTVPHAHGAPHPAGQYRRLDRPPGRANTSSVPLIGAGLSAARDQARQMARGGDADLRAMAHAMLKIMFGSDFPAPIAARITG